MKAENAQLRAEMRTGFAEIRGEVRALAAHMDSLEYWGAIVIGAATIIFGFVQYFQNKRAERERISDEIKEQLKELRQKLMARPAEASEASRQT